MSRPSRIWRLPVVELAMEIRQVLLGQRHRVHLVARNQADDPVAPLYVDGPDVLRAVLAESATFDHRRAAHADVGVGGPMITSHVPARAALPAKQRPETMDTNGTWPLSAPSVRKVGTSRPAMLA